MLLEKNIELRMVNHLDTVLSGLNVEVVSSWEPSEEGKVKQEELRDKDALVSLFIQPRQHDEFSLPMVTMVGTLVIDARVETCPTMSEVSPLYNAVMSKFDEWHYNCDQFSRDISGEDFYAAALKLNGGNNITYNKDTSTWQVTLTFTIRGTEYTDYVPPYVPDYDLLNSKLELALYGEED